MLAYKLVSSVAAICLTFVMFLPYIRSIYRGETRPHVFTWVIWGMGTMVVFFAQLEGKGGIGAWPIGVSGAVTIYIALLAYRRRGETAITRVDWIFFLAALSALPFWFLTADPLWAVVILTVVDLSGFGPTVRKAYWQPQAENISLYSLGAARNLLVILALEYYSLTTVLFPAAIALACLLFVLMLTYRRHILADEA